MLLADRRNGIGHVNNLYNTTFWSMVLKGGMSATDAEMGLKVQLQSCDAFSNPELLQFKAD